MKKIYILFLICFGCLFAKAQYVLTAAANPAIGDVNSTISIDTTGLTTNTTIATGQTWNYSGITQNTTASVSSTTFVSISSVPNNSLFPGANIGEMNAGGLSYTVYKNTTGITSMGSAAAAATDCVVYSDPITLYSFPMTYGTVNFDTFGATSGGSTVTGSLTTYGDATGTLILPNGSYTNVLRLKLTVNEIYSGAATGTINIIQYRYYSAASKFLLLSVSNQTSLIAGFPPQINKSGTVQSLTFAGINEIKNESGFSFYPNPTSNKEISLQFNLKVIENYEVNIVNVMGQVVKTISFGELSPGSYNKTIDLRELSSGIYYLKLSGQKSQRVEKLIIE